MEHANPLCFYPPTLWNVGMILGIFLLAYLGYRIVLLLLGSLGKSRGKIGRTSLKKPLGMLFFLGACGFSIDLILAPSVLKDRVWHVLWIFLLTTGGWLCVRITQLFFRETLSQLQEEEVAPPGTRRTLLTQMLFLYKALLAFIVLVTVAAILLTIPAIRSLGLGLLGSAGVAGIALGLAARPLLVNVISGFQIALTKILNIGDTVLIEGQKMRIESLHLAHAIARTWDERRWVIPIGYFLDKPFENWDLCDAAMLASVFLLCDYTVPVAALREKTQEILSMSPWWTGGKWALHVTEAGSKGVEIRISMSVENSTAAFELQCDLREKLLDYLSTTYPHAFPCTRALEATWNP